MHYWIREHEVFSRESDVNLVREQNKVDSLPYIRQFTRSNITLLFVWQRHICEA